MGRSRVVILGVVVFVPVLATCFAIPFVVLLSREVKRRAGSLFAICALVVVGMWLERYLLVVPSVWSEDWAPFGGLEALITLGFLAAAALCYLGFARTFPLRPLADLEFQQESHK